MPSPPRNSVQAIPPHDEQPRESISVPQDAIMSPVTNMSAEIVEEAPIDHNRLRCMTPRSQADHTNLERGDMPDGAGFWRQGEQDYKQWAFLVLGCIMQLQGPSRDDYARNRLARTSLYIFLAAAAFILTVSVLTIPIFTKRPLPPVVRGLMLAVASAIVVIESFIIKPFCLSST